MAYSTIFDSVKIDDVDSFMLERYKYILEQKKTANEITFKVAGIFQAVFVPIVAAQMLLVRDCVHGDVSEKLAKAGSAVLLILTMFLFFTCCTLIIGGIASWIKYRRDESDIEYAVFGARRPLPHFGNIFRWYETYILFGMVAMEAAYCIALPNIVVPMLNR